MKKNVFKRKDTIESGQQNSLADISH